MVILDKIRIPSKKVLYIIGISTVVFLVLLMGLMFKKISDEKALAAKAKSIILKEASDKKSYEDTIVGIVKSPNLNSMRLLFDDIYNDMLFFRDAGWKEDEVYCNVNVCNIRYKREKHRLFEYIILNKGDSSYEPVFNENELTYEGVTYLIDLESNIVFEENMSTLANCTDFISSSYKFKSLLNNDGETSVSVGIPSGVFSLGNKYNWATYSHIKKGEISVSTKNIFNVDLVQQEYVSDLIRFKTLNLQDHEFKFSFDYFCI